MDTHILDRYSRTDEGLVIIDIAANRVEELYSDYDNTAHFLKKDLEPDLVEYLVESAREIGKEPFGIRFSFASPVDEESTSRVCQSISTYFTYLGHRETRELKQMFRTSVILLLVGLAILTLAVRIEPVHRAQRNGRRAGVCRGADRGRLGVAVECAGHVPDQLGAAPS